MPEANQARFKRQASRKSELTRAKDRELFQYAADSGCVGGGEKTIEIHALNPFQGARNSAIDPTHAYARPRLD
jgi:hypothetical protein